MSTNLIPLQDADLQRFAPSVFTDHALPGVSDRYQFVRTSDVLNTMRDVGYIPVQAGQARSRTEDGRVYTRHVVKMTHKDNLKPKADRRVGDVIPQIVLTNSHNRTSSFQLMAGLYRLVCSNGMVTSAGEFANVRVLHNDPEIHAHIIDGTNLIRELTESVVTPQVSRMLELELADSTIREFAEAATFLKFGDVRPDHVEHFLNVRREADEGRSLWAVLNRVQENAVRGGYTVRDAAGRNVTQRGIGSITRDADFNVNLWQLGAKVLELAD